MESAADTVEVVGVAVAVGTGVVADTEAVEVVADIAAEVAETAAEVAVVTVASFCLLFLRSLLNMIYNRFS